MQGGVRGQPSWKVPQPEAEPRTKGLGGGSRRGGSWASNLGVHVHLSCAEQQADHLQVPNFGCVVEAGGAILLLRDTGTDESSSWHV